MSRAEELRAALAVAELEEELVVLKAAGDDAALASCKEELRYARWVHRGGPDEELDALDDTGEHTNRAAAALFLRWRAENPEG